MIGGIVQGDGVLILVRNVLVFDLGLYGLSMAHVQHLTLEGGTTAYLQLIKEAVYIVIKALKAEIAVGAFTVFFKISLIVVS